MIKYVCDRCEAEFREAESLIRLSDQNGTDFDICAACYRWFIDSFMNPIKDVSVL